jgi:hypothetical protein
VVGRGGGRPGPATGPGGVTAAQVQGRTLWLLGLPTAKSGVVAVPVNLDTLKTGSTVTLLAAGVAAVSPDGKSMYVGAQDELGPFVAKVSGGKVERTLDLDDFRLTPLLTLSPESRRLI